MLIAKFPDMFAQTELNWYHYCLPSMHRWFLSTLMINNENAELHFPGCLIFAFWKLILTSIHQHNKHLFHETCVCMQCLCMCVYVCVCMCMCVCACDKLHLCVNAVDRVADILSGRHYHWEGQQDHRGDAPEFVFLIRNTNICTMDQIAMGWKAYQCSRNTLESMWMCETWKICNYWENLLFFGRFKFL